MEPTQLLKLALDIGEALLKSGAEVYRVEDSVVRMLNAYGAQRVDAFTIPSSIVVTLLMPDSEPITQTRRIMSGKTNFDCLSRLNALCRSICKNTPEVKDAEAQLTAILSAKPYPFFVQFLAYAVISFAFAVFFGGTLSDGLASFIGGAILFLTLRLLQKLDISAVFTHLGGACAAAGSALILVALGLGTHVDKILIGNIMLLIPGIELTNGMRDLFSGDILAGLLHIGEAVFLATIIALGGAYILSLGGMV